MAKSTGNLVLVRDLLADHEGAALRLLLLHRRWSEPWEYDDAQLAGAATLLERLRAAAGRPGNDGGAAGVLAALLDDLDVPAAVERALADEGEAARTLLSVLRLTA
jgi:cysteinyl-tRNA synthetase